MTKNGVTAAEQNAGRSKDDGHGAGKEGLSAFLAQLNSPVFQISDLGLSWNEQELLREAVLSVAAIRFGSISLVIHEGHLVEVSKTIRIRSGPVAASRKRENKS